MKNLDAYMRQLSEALDEQMGQPITVKNVQLVNLLADCYTDLCRIAGHVSANDEVELVYRQHQG